MILVIHIWISVRIIYISPSKQQKNIVQLCTRSLFSFRQSALIVVLCYPHQGGHFLPFGGVAMSIMYTESVLPWMQYAYFVYKAYSCVYTLCSDESWHSHDMHLELSRLAFTEWQELVTCERITKASFLSLAPPYPPFSSLFLILTLKRPLLSQSGPHLVTHAWKNKLNWNLSDSLLVFTAWIRLGSMYTVTWWKNSFGLEKLTEPHCFFVFV